MYSEMNNISYMCNYIVRVNILRYLSLAPRLSQKEVTKSWAGPGNKAMNVSMEIKYLEREEEIYNKIL